MKNILSIVASLGLVTSSIAGPPAETANEWQRALLAGLSVQSIQNIANQSCKNLKKTAEGKRRLGFYINAILQGIKLKKDNEACSKDRLFYTKARHDQIRLVLAPAKALAKYNYYSNDESDWPTPVEARIVYLPYSDSEEIKLRTRLKDFSSAIQKAKESSLDGSAREELFKKIEITQDHDSSIVYDGNSAPVSVNAQNTNISGVVISVTIQKAWDFALTDTSDNVSKQGFRYGLEGYHLVHVCSGRPMEELDAVTKPEIECVNNLRRAIAAKVSPKPAPPRPANAARTVGLPR